MKLSPRQMQAVFRATLVEVDPELDADGMHDAVLEALTNEAPAVKAYNAEQSKGAYSVVIAGVPGAYFISAVEYDDIGVFDSLAEAEAAVQDTFGEFLVPTRRKR